MIFSLLLLFHLPLVIMATDVCNTTKVQIAFVLDRSKTFENNHHLIKHAMYPFMATLEATYPGSKVALTSFSDFKKTQRSRREARDYNQKNQCYAMEIPFTTDVDEIFGVIRSLAVSGSGYKDYRENSITAALLAAADASIGWINTPVQNGKIVQKIVFILTDNDAVINRNISFTQPKYRRLPVGDGTDNCENILIPDYTTASRIFKEKRVKMMTTLSSEKHSPDYLFKPYVNHFNTIQIPYILMQHVKDKEEMAADWMKSINALVPCEKCVLNTPRKIQLAFVIDRKSFHDVEFYKEFALISNKIAQNLTNKFAGSQFALTVFTDYTSNQWQHSFSPYPDSYSCYNLELPFTPNPKYIEDAIKNVELFPENPPKPVGSAKSHNHITALAYTAVDAQIGWLDELHVFKIMALVTDADTHGPTHGIDEIGSFLDAGERSGPKLDGTDDCENSFLPLPSALKTVLQRKKINLMGILSDEKNKGIFGTWTAHFNKINAKYNLVELYKLDSLVERVLKSVELLTTC